MIPEATSAGVVYACAILLLILLMIAVRNDVRSGYQHNHIPVPSGGGMYIMAHMALWMMVGSLVFAGLVDVLMWAMRSEDPTVSDLVWYYFTVYPWLAWIAAGLAYHLLVNTPRLPHQ